MFLSLTMCQTYPHTFITGNNHLFSCDRLWFRKGVSNHGKNCWWICCKESWLAMASQPANGWHPFLWGISDKWGVAPDCCSLLWHVSPWSVSISSEISPVFLTFTSRNSHPFVVNHLRPPSGTRDCLSGLEKRNNYWEIVENIR